TLGAGGGLLLQHGRLVGTDPRSTELICEACRRACVAPRRGSAFTVIDRRSNEALQVQTIPLCEHQALGRVRPEPMVLVMVGGAPHGVHEVATLQAMFGFTPAEARVAAALARGGTPEAIRR